MKMKHLFFEEKTLLKDFENRISRRAFGSKWDEIVEWSKKDTLSFT